MNNRLKDIEKVSNYITVDLAKMVEKVCRSCLNCRHFVNDVETCDKFRKRPPARIIAFGCKDFEIDDEIPF